MFNLDMERSAITLKKKREKKTCFRASMSKIRKMAVQADPSLALFHKWQKSWPLENRERQQTDGQPD